jgi:signal transduction histidine kinase
MGEEIESKKNLEFKISTGLKNILGKDLITDDFIAIFELVKNSYDAHAQKVVITFSDDKIIIADNGKGMSYDDLKNKWFFLAYSAKKDNTEDVEDGEKKISYRDKIKQRKHYAGAKGIGRFSSDRLGKLLFIKTKKYNKPFEQINIDWTLFEKDQKNIFEKIKFPLYSLISSDKPFPEKSTYGTILEISRLHDKWDRKKIIDLKHSLEKLINPFSQKEDFSIDIICEKEKIEDKSGVYKNGPNKGIKYIERDKVNGPVKNAILDILELKTCHISYTIEKGKIETKITDRNELVYHISEKVSQLKIIEHLKIDLYFLNRKAKQNFTSKMGIEPVNFGSILLFKNGFRVQPFGETGDDSWGIDFRAQQGYNRFLGTRDLFGRVDIVTNNVDEFKEVSSRDGGLVKTKGNKELFDCFEIAHRRLERYVVGVLWGEGFIRRKYFGEGDDAVKAAQQYRELLSSDKDSENLKIAKNNFGSKLDFIQIIKSLSSNKDIQIINYNKDLVNIVNEQLDNNQIKFISDLDDIAEFTNDKDLKNKIKDIENKFKKLQKEKELAEKKAELEEQKRKVAEEKTKIEEKAKIEAERQRKEETERRRKAELATLRKEKERAEAELAKFKAEQKAKEEEEKRKKVENENERRKEQITRHRAAESIEYKDLRDSNHIIGVYADDIAKKILLLKRRIDKNIIIENNELLNFIQGISMANEKIATLTRFTTKSNYLKASLETTENIVTYIINYIEHTYKLLYKIDVEFINPNVIFIKTFQPIELCVVLDNILINSRKKKAEKVIFEFNKVGNILQINIRDVGEKLSNTIQNHDLIFEEGITTTRGAGLGLSHVKRIIEEDLNGTVEYNPTYKKGFELIIKLKK